MSDSISEFGPKCPIHGPGCPGTCNEAAAQYADELIKKNPKGLTFFLNEGQNYFTARNWTSEQAIRILEKLQTAIDSAT